MATNGLFEDEVSPLRLGIRASASQHEWQYEYPQCIQLRLRLIRTTNSLPHARQSMLGSALSGWGLRIELDSLGVSTMGGGPETGYPTTRVSSFSDSLISAGSRIGIPLGGSRSLVADMIAQPSDGRVKCRAASGKRSRFQSVRAPSWTSTFL